MLYGFIDGGDDPDGKYQIQIFGWPVLLCRLFGLRHKSAGLRTTSKLHGGFPEALGDSRQKRFGFRFVDQEGLHGVAHSWSLNLCIVSDFFCHTEVCVRIHIYVANPLEMLQDWNLGVFNNKSDEPLSSPIARTAASTGTVG